MEMKIDQSNNRQTVNFLYIKGCDLCSFGDINNNGLKSKALDQNIYCFSGLAL
jgi:hypothetical protein